jgi:heme A synthase
MSKLDKEKETIGYLKVIFSICIAVNISLIAWLYKNYKEMTLMENILLLVLIIVIAFGIMYSNKKILNKIDLLEDL